MWNEDGIRKIYEGIKLEGIEVGEMTNDEMLEGCFYGVLSNNARNGVITIYTEKRLIFIQLTPSGEINNIIPTTPDEVTDIKIKKGLFFNYVTIGDINNEMTLRVGKKMFGLKKQGEYFEKFCEQSHRYYMSE